MDIFSPDAPAGSRILLQLEHLEAKTSIDYPAVIHSRYQAHLPEMLSPGWHHLTFEYFDTPDTNQTATVNSIVLLFAPDSFSSHTYYYDNLKG